MMVRTVFVNLADPSFYPSSLDQFLPASSPDPSESSQASGVVGLLDAIGVERFFVLGTSYGRFVAGCVASLCCMERVAKVVVASSRMNMRKRNNEKLARKAGVEHVEEVLMPETPVALRRLVDLTVWIPKVARRRNVRNDALANVINKMYVPNRKEKLELLKGLNLGRDDTPNATPLEQDVLLIWGEKDQLFPLEMTLELKEYGFLFQSAKIPLSRQFLSYCV